MLRAFCRIRDALEDCQFQRTPRRAQGWLTITADRLPDLTLLQENGNVESITKDGRSCSHLPDVVGSQVTLILNPQSLHYYEDLQDLVSYAVEEPAAYHVHGIGAVRSEASGGDSENASIAAYRQMLHARKLLRNTADWSDTGRVIFLTPGKLEIPLTYTDPMIPALAHLRELESEFEKRPDKDPADYDQRLVLFRKSLREYLKSHAPEDRFKLFLRNFETIYDSYKRDYHLWVGNTFGELEKSFEEKRLKFVSDLNGILAGVQASLLAVPIAAILLGDKYDLDNPLKDFLLAFGVLGVALIALRLLMNQEATLDATRNAINSTKEDFEKKHTRRHEEFKTRLTSLDSQEQRVRSLLKFIQIAIYVIVGGAFLVAFIASGVTWKPQLTVLLSNRTNAVPAGTNAAPAGTNAAAGGTNAAPAGTNAVRF